MATFDIVEDSDSLPGFVIKCCGNSLSIHQCLAFLFQQFFALLPAPPTDCVIVVSLCLTVFHRQIILESVKIVQPEMSVRLMNSTTASVETTSSFY